MAGTANPSADDKARYETLKTELMQALPKKRAIDKQLACLKDPILCEDTNLTYHTGTN
jgi:chromatin modification-related protein EAF6